MQRLGKNKGRYFGETIDIDKIMADVERTALESGWQFEFLTASENLRLVTLGRSPAEARKNVYLSTGIHGDEPAGPLAVWQLVHENRWPDSLRIWLCPCLNPEGFRLNSRENAAGVDLNRDYRHLQSETVRAHVAWLQRLPRFDLALCLHEDWESNGFYLYELNPDQQRSLAGEIVNRVAEICPVDRSPMIEGREAHEGIVRANPDPESRPQWPEAFYLVQHKTRLSYTFEAPSDFPLSTRIAALTTATKTALALLDSN